MKTVKIVCLLVSILLLFAACGTAGESGKDSTTQNGTTAPLPGTTEAAGTEITETPELTSVPASGTETPVTETAAPVTTETPETTEPATEPVTEPVTEPETTAAQTEGSPEDPPKPVLPVIRIEIEGGKKVTSKDEYINCTFTMDYNGCEGSESYKEVVSAPAGIRGRGHSSWELEKKPYKLKFESKVSFFGLTKAKKWVLQPNHTDRTLIRNTLAMRIGALLDNMLFVPHSYLVDLYVNGAYAGVYSLSEPVEVNKGRVEGEEDSSAIDTDYLIEMGEDAAPTSFGYNQFHSTLLKYMAVKNPGEEVLTSEQLSFISEYFEKADRAVISGVGYEEYIDIDSLIDWFILDEFSYNVDGSFRRSDFFLKKSGGKIYLAAPWDFDYAFGNFSLDDPSYQGWICLGNAKTDAYKGKYIQTNWMDYLLNDDAFRAKLKARWQEIGPVLYQTAKDTVNSLAASVRPSAAANFAVWPNVFGKQLQYESAKSRTLMTYDEQVDYLLWFLDTRYRWMNAEIAKY